MARLGVTKDDVLAACEALKTRGVTVTVANVRAELGTGSYTTLLPLIQEFHQREKAGIGAAPQGRPPETSPALSELGAGFIAQLWTQAWQEAQKEMNAREEKWQAEREESARVATNQAEALAQALSDLKHLEAEQEHLHAELTESQASGHKKDAELILLRNQLGVREAEAKVTLERAVSAETALHAKNDEFTRALSEKERLKSEADGLRRELAASQASDLKKDGETSLLKRQLSESATENKELLKRVHTAEERLAQAEAREVKKKS
jgi:hypothetical protein